MWISIASASRAAAVCCALLLFVVCCGRVLAADVFLLNCDRYDGEHEFQIYINLDEGYVLYNAQVRNGSNFDRVREYDLVGAKDGGTIEVDDGLQISTDNDFVIKASDESATFLLAKRSGTYAYAWTSILPPNESGRLIAFGNHHEGKCSTNPFAPSGEDHNP